MADSLWQMADGPPYAICHTLYANSRLAQGAAEGIDAFAQDFAFVVQFFLLALGNIAPVQCQERPCNNLEAGTHPDLQVIIESFVRPLSRTLSDVQADRVHSSVELRGKAVILFTRKLSRCRVDLRSIRSRHMPDIKTFESERQIARSLRSLNSLWPIAHSLSLAR